MLEHVYERVSMSRYLTSVIVATDDERIEAEARRFGARVQMTRDDHESGTDRVAEVASSHPDVELVVNIQGDEPLIDPAAIDAAVLPLLEERAIQMGTLKKRIEDPREISDPNVVKVVTDRFPQAKVLIHRLDEPKLRRPNAMAMFLPFTIPPRGADAFVEDRQKLKIGSIDVEVIHTPGHAPGHVMYQIPSAKVLIGGDLIIMGAVGRTDFADSDPAALNASIRRVMKLPANTQLLPGHGPPSHLDDERANNEWVQAALEETNS